MSRIRIADDPGSWGVPDDIKNKTREPLILTECPHCHVPWMHHDQSTCSRPRGEEDGA